MISTDKLKGLKKRFSQMKEQKEKLVPVWREIAKFITPKRGHFNDEEPNQGKREDLLMVDATPSRALGILQAGMQGGMTSPGDRKSVV